MYICLLQVAPGGHRQTDWSGLKYCSRGETLVSPSKGQLVGARVLMHSIETSGALLGWPRWPGAVMRPPRPPGLVVRRHFGTTLAKKTSSRQDQ